MLGGGERDLGKFLFWWWDYEDCNVFWDVFEAISSEKESKEILGEISKTVEGFSMLFDGFKVKTMITTAI